MHTDVSELSHVAGPTDPPLRYTTIGAALDATAARFPDREAIVSCHQHARRTYAQLQADVDALAAGFIALGLAPGDRVGIWAPNCLEWAVTQYATAKAGLILVNINPAYRVYELEFALNKVGCRALVTAETFKTSNYIAMLTALAPELASATPGALDAERLPALDMVITLGETGHPGCLRYADVPGLADRAARDALLERQGALSPDDAINIQFTSGTTGSPKGATLSHKNILNNAFFVGNAIGLTEADRVCVPVPLYHCFGMVMGNLACLQSGAAVVYPAPAFDARKTLDAITTERCTANYGVPTMFVAELEVLAKQDFDLSSLRTGIMAGAPCPVAVMERVVSDMHMSEVTIAYGMTETSPVSWQSGRNDSLERRVSTVGTVHPHVEVKVVDEHGATVPRGVQGEFMTRGYSVMLGYWDDDEKTADSITGDGWMQTGDLGVIDTEGYGNITGRVKDMVVRGGENLFPREIEEFLLHCPDVQDVQVFGVPDDKYGEELCAWIIARDGKGLTADRVRQYCDGQIAHFKIPRYIEFVDDFPMTVTGKAQKFEMRNSMCEKLGLKAQKTA